MAKTSGGGAKRLTKKIKPAAPKKPAAPRTAAAPRPAAGPPKISLPSPPNVTFPAPQVELFRGIGNRIAQVTGQRRGRGRTPQGQKFR